MRILFTGASSFTGYWFVSELARRGHEVVAVLRSAPGKYEGVRRQRVERVVGDCRAVFEGSFGDGAFLALIGSDGPWDVFCHHAAEVSNYRSPEFDAVRAVASNTRRLPAVLAALVEQGCGRVVLTGSVFESGEGAGSEGLRAFSPYGLSKALTAQVFQYHTQALGLCLGKFVISNPFGPFEEARFTSYMVRSWYAGETPKIRTPDYVRDNIHVSLLACAYSRFVEGLGDAPGFERLAPSGYVAKQGEFARRFAAELEPRLGIPCPIELATQESFEEPRVRINIDVPDTISLGWKEAEAWDELADYYRATRGEAR
ncbi:MAG: NAD(P)-dependent oxidoreductase [Candidatus Bipolaricaulota bacterium]|nr:MAG: NAD(P)-dependent oxidoreductase [Candidatus Bipolaricaulota bacterium]